MRPSSSSAEIAIARISFSDKSLNFFSIVPFLVVAGLQTRFVPRRPRFVEEKESHKGYGKVIFRPARWWMTYSVSFGLLQGNARPAWRFLEHLRSWGEMRSF